MRTFVIKFWLFAWIICLSTTVRADGILDGTWLLAGDGCSNESPRVLQTLGTEYWKFTDNTYEHGQDTLTGAEDPSCKVKAEGSFVIPHGAADGSFQIQLKRKGSSFCIVKTNEGAYTLRVPQFERTTTYDSSTSKFQFGSFQGVDALIEDVAAPNFMGCEDGRYRYYYVRPIGS